LRWREGLLRGRVGRIKERIYRDEEDGGDKRFLIPSILFIPVSSFLNIWGGQINMSSFNYFKRKVYNKELSIWERLAAVRSCIAKLSINKRVNYYKVLQSYDEKYGFDRYRDINNEPPSEELLIRVFEEVEKERISVIAANPYSNP
jgi:hypothetical protein